MGNVLFEITEEHLETGMRGFPVGYCPTSYVDPQKGLYYIGTPIREVVSHLPEEVIFALFRGKWGEPDEVSAFIAKFDSRCQCSDEVVKQIQMLPRSGHPMELFQAAMLIMGMIEGKRDYKEDGFNLIAKLPHLAAVVINHHGGFGPTPNPDPKRHYMDNFTDMVQVGGDKNKLFEVFRLFNILHMDHGGGNLSAFVGKAVASGLEGMFGSLASAMCALAGPRHGRANQDSLEFVQSVLTHVGENATEADVEAVVRHKLANKELIFGFGHAVLRVEDPRATIMYEFAEKNFPDHPLVRTALLLRTATPKVLKENKKIQNPYPNIDAMSGSMLMAAGFAYPEYYTILFGLARCIGIAAQIIYERFYARDGKGTPIVRPKYIYKSLPLNS